MSSEQIARVKALFAAALRVPEPERDRFLASQCDSDEEDRLEVERLLRQHQSAGDFLNKPLPEWFGASISTRLPVAPGTVLKNRYRIERLLAESGFATVYLASDVVLAEKPFVVKVLDRCHTPKGLRDTFQSELRSLSRIHHSNVVGIIDAGELDDGKPYLVLTYVPGMTLRAALRNGRLASGRALSILQGIGNALTAAHHAGVWHLDLKPENVIISEPGTPHEHVTVIDFGIARLKHLPELAQAGGSRQYMAPEQDSHPSAQSDQYSLAKLVVEMLTGHPPAPDSPIEAQLLRRASRRQARTLERALRQDPTERFPSVYAFLHELSAEPSVSWRGPLAVVLSIAGAAGLTVWYTGQARVAVPPSKPVPLIVSEGFNFHPTFSPDGKWIYYTVGPQGRFAIYRREVAGGDSLRIAGQQIDRPQCSPDGKLLAYLRIFTTGVSIVVKASDASGPERELARGSDYDSLAWAPGGKELVVSQADDSRKPRRLRLLEVNTGRWRELWLPPPVAGGDMRPAFSPDGEHLAFVRRWNQAASDLFVGDLDGGLNPKGAPRQVTHSTERIEAVQWTPDSRDLVYVSGPLNGGSIWRIRASGGKPSPLLVGVDRVENVSIPAKRWELAYSVNLSDTNVWRLSLDKGTQRVTQVIAGPHEDRDAHLSPDARQIAFASTRSGALEAWTANQDGAGVRQITSFGNADFMELAWTRDSAAVIVSVRSRTVGERVYRVNTNDGGLIAPHEIIRDGMATSVSRDGRWCYFRRRRDNDRWQLWRVELENPKREEVLTSAGGYYGIESVNGKDLYFSQQDEDQGLWRQSLPGGQAVKVVDNLYRRNLFAPTEGGLLFVAGPSTETSQVLYYRNIREGRTTRIYEFRRQLFFGLDLSPDQHSLLFSQFDSDNSEIMLVGNFR